jgi:hypothetical protein
MDIQGATKVNETSERNTPADNTCVCVCAQPNKTTQTAISLFVSSSVTSFFVSLDDAQITDSIKIQRTRHKGERKMEK